MPPVGSRALRLGFAMGGGVSLGAFQGAALAQAAKLAVARATYVADESDAIGTWTDKQGKVRQDVAGKTYLYNDVVIDVFSGASAGALSLVVMLSALLADVPRTAPKYADAVVALRGDADVGNEIVDDFAAQMPDRLDLLVAAQRMQDLQWQVWTQDIGIEKLLEVDPGPAPSDLNAKASILNRGALERIAKARLPVGAPAAAPPLLGERVLFACTMANLTSIIADATSDAGGAEAKGDPVGDATAAAMRDALRSNVHRELRVFDIFNRDLTAAPAAAGPAMPNDPEMPGRWRRFHRAPGPFTPTGKLHGSLGDPGDRTAVFKEIAATAIACGAFPGAFEPVPVTRYRHEFIDSEWRALLGGAAAPDSHVFHYVDGGTFSNEPIREAYRLASYMDSRLLADARTHRFDRRVVFVSPNVSGERADVALPVLREFELTWGFWGPSVRRVSTLDRLLPHVGTLLTAVIDQGRCNEEDKIAQTRARFGKRDARRTFLKAALRPPTGDALDALTTDVLDMMAEASAGVWIPVTPLDLAGEFRRVIWEETYAAPGGAANLTAAEAEALARDADAVAGPLKGGDGSAVAARADAATWFWLAMCVSLDLVLDLGGKERDSKALGIAPFALSPVVGAGGEVSYDTQPLRMPASALFAFGGFLSCEAARHAFETGRFAAWNFLAAAGFIPAAVKDPAAAPACGDVVTEMGTRVNVLLDRVRAIVKGTSLGEGTLFDAAKPFLADYVAGKVRDQLNAEVNAILNPGPAARACELRLVTPGTAYKLRRPAFHPNVPSVVLPDARPALVAFGTFDYASGTWRVSHLDGAQKEIGIDKDAPFDPEFCDVEVPPPVELAKTDTSPYPVLEAIIPSTPPKPVPGAAWKATEVHSGLDQTLDLG